ncbi:hypothetical protein QYE76_044175 [Lolium multiflorum]|uniref:Uncharacterized protein n=1 Tax=Lolium multiflorum TaxID=4521 RepID=A0AAD8WW74_LOLMU|nr:hypothetical protein QYE76_044175 [Lolium multiflorum]
MGRWARLMPMRALAAGRAGLVRAARFEVFMLPRPPCWPCVVSASSLLWLSRLHEGRHRAVHSEVTSETADGGAHGHVLLRLRHGQRQAARGEARWRGWGGEQPAHGFHLQPLPLGFHSWRRIFGPPASAAPRLEANHVLELKEARETGRKEVEDLSRRLKDVEDQSRALRDEVTSKSQELTDTAKRWVVQMSALDRGLAGEHFIFSLPAFGCRLPA